MTCSASSATAVYNASGLEYYRHSDWLGSSRLASTASRTVYYDGAYAAYGENYAETGTQDRNFTGQDQDIVPSGAYPLYDFLMREYHPTWGRWLSPDPAGLAAANPGNPQSWNRYAYVMNNPTNFVDPLGLDSWAPKLCERTANCDMTIFSGSYDLFLGGYYAEFGLLNIPVYASGWYWDADAEPYGAWTYGPVQVGYASDYLLGDFSPADGQAAGVGGGTVVGKGKNGQKVISQTQLTPQQQQCVQNEINKADRARADFLNAMGTRMLERMGKGFAAGALTGAEVGAASGFADLGLTTPGGTLFGAVVGGVLGAGNAALEGTVEEGVEEARYDYPFLGFPSLYASKLTRDIQKNCGVTVTVQ